MGEEGGDAWEGGAGVWHVYLQPETLERRCSLIGEQRGGWGKQAGVREPDVGFGLQGGGG